MTDRKRIFQVAYCEEHFLARAHLLRRQGLHRYIHHRQRGCKSRPANAAPGGSFDHRTRAPEETRLDMVAWLCEGYPRTSILALNPSHEQLGTLPVQRGALPTAGLVAIDRGGIGLRHLRHHGRIPWRSAAGEVRSSCSFPTSISIARGAHPLNAISVGSYSAARHLG